MAQRLTLHSGELAEDITFDIFLPRMYADTSGRPAHYPLIYVLDGETYGRLVATLVNTMAQSHAVPEAIVVAIHTSSHRVRDFTPTASLFDWQGKASKEFKNSGGGDRYLTFLQRELIPYIDSHYRTVGDRTVLGHSLAGLIALHSFLTQAQQFQAYLAIDPSLWWDQQCLARKAEALDSPQALHGRLYCALADYSNTNSNEFSAVVEGSSRFTTALANLAKRPKATFDITSVMFEGETHASVVIPSVYQGLKVLFKDWHGNDS